MNDYLDYLQHHGIKGQKWGVRRFQNSDGSLTALGKERLYSEEDSRKEWESAKRNFRTNSFGIEIDSEGIKEAGKFLTNQSKVLTEEFDNICKKTADHYNELRDNKQFKKEVIDTLKKEFTAPNMVDDKEFLDMEMEYAIDDISHKYMSKDLNDSWARFNDGVETYYNNAKSITEDIVGSYGDRTIRSVSYKYKSGLAELFAIPTREVKDHVYSDVVKDSLLKLGDSAWVHYLNNHTEMAYLEEPGLSARDRCINSIMDEWKKVPDYKPGR